MTLRPYDGHAVVIVPGQRRVHRQLVWGRAGSRFCPACQAGSGGRWQLAWRLGWSFACTRHHVLLADRCPACLRTPRLRAHPRRDVPRLGLCSSAAEIIFDRGLGDLFVVRTAGHVAGPEVLGSIEYGVSVLGAPLVVVLGHDACGAVAATRAAIEGGMSAGGYVRDVIERVTPSVLAARAAGRTEDADFIAEHIRHTVDLLLDRSRVLAQAVEAGQVAVVGLSYRLADGTARLVTARGLEAPADAVS